jgi:CheY-like chemotaxis protein
MEQCILQPEIESKQERRQLMVALLGFDAEDEAKLTRAFKIMRLNERNYIAAKPDDKVRCNIILVNYDNPAARREKDWLLGLKPRTPVVVFSSGPLNETVTYHIRGALIAARVLNILNQVLIEPPSETTRAPSQKIADSHFQHHLETPAAPTRTSSADKSAQAVAVKTYAPTVEGYHALVVDDSIATQKSLELNLVILPQIDIIDFADSGESALKKAEAKQYDLIFLDIMMPGIDGYETCARLRKKPEYKKTPIIMVSAKTSPLDEVKGILAGCTTYLTKPVETEEFQKLGVKVLAWLEMQKRH